MLTSQDLTKIGKLLTPLVTKRELKVLKTDLQQDMSLLATKQEVRLLGEKVDSMRETLDSLLTAIDGLTKAISNLQIEYAAITSQLNRHERWIQQIAQKAKIKLELEMAV
jgi:predicted  nucleic acid-binding Zn-ribbon protein